MTEAQWFYEQRGERKGPVTQPRLEELLCSQQVGLTTLVWRTGFADWVQLGNTELAPVAAVSPPPLRIKVSDSLVWLIACSPMIGLLINVVAGAENYWLSGIFFVVLACIDVSNLRKGGYLKPATWWVLVPFAYLFCRSRVLGKNQAPFIVWCVLSLASFALQSVPAKF